MTDELADLWVAFKASPSEKVREQLIVAYLPLVRYVAVRMAQQLHSSLEQQDLISYGTFGLLDAIDKFDLAHRVKFETYAMPRIRGAIIDELRQLDWAPRSLRSRSRAVDRAVHELGNELGRTPTPVEVADRMGLTPEELREYTSEVRASQFDSLDRLIVRSKSVPDDSQTTLGDTLVSTLSDATIPVEMDEARVLLAEGMDLLSDNDRTMLAMYYVEGCTLREIADVLEVSESRASQLHTRVLVALQRRLSSQY